MHLCWELIIEFRHELIKLFSFLLPLKSVVDMFGVNSLA